MSGQNVSRETLAWRWVTDRGLRVVSGEATIDLYRLLEDASLPEVVELVPADGSLLVVLKPGAPVSVGLMAILNDAAAEKQGEPPGSRHKIAVEFNGEDLPGVAARLGLPESELVDGLCGIAFTVKFLGFQPGFAYLEGLPQTWHLPRLDNPRKSVPAGSVAMGGPYCGIYPAAGPGGWHLLGRSDAVLFNPAANPPALFQPGDTVRLCRS